MIIIIVGEEKERRVTRTRQVNHLIRQGKIPPLITDHVDTHLPSYASYSNMNTVMMFHTWLLAMTRQFILCILSRMKVRYSDFKVSLNIVEKRLTCVSVYQIGKFCCR